MGHLIGVEKIKKPTEVGLWMLIVLSPKQGSQGNDPCCY